MHRMLSSAGQKMLGSLLLLTCSGALAGVRHAIVERDNSIEQSSTGSEEFSRCSQLFQNSVFFYQMLAKKLPTDFKKVPQLPTYPLLHMKQSDCRENLLAKQINHALSTHSGKIGLLLPLSSWPDSTRQAVVAQINALVQARGADPAKTLVWMDTYGTREGLESRLAQMVFVHHVGLLIGGLTLAEAPVLASWAHALRIPSIILNRRNEKASSKYIFYLGPDLRMMASSLTRHALDRGLRRITIMMPQSSRDGVLVDNFIEQAKHLGLEIDGPYLYQNYDYPSMDSIVRKIFRIEDPARAAEQLELMTRMKEKAEKEGASFDSRSAVLPPQVDTSAVMIVDNFKNVRHLVRIMNFYGVRRLPLLGVPKWRAFELVDSSEEMLRGSVFVDYIGRYQDLPYQIKPQLAESDFFVKPTEAGATDLKLVIAHAVYAAQQALAGERTPRFALYRRLESSQPPPGTFFATPTIFRSNHLSYWPSFVFSAADRTLQMLQIWNPTQPDKKSSTSSLAKP